MINEIKSSCQHWHSKGKGHAECTNTRSFQDVKEKACLSDIVVDESFKIKAVTGKKKNVFNTVLTCITNESGQKVKIFCQKLKKKVQLEQPTVVPECYKSMVNVNHMDQNITTYKIIELGMVTLLDSLLLLLPTKNSSYTNVICI